MEDKQTRILDAAFDKFKQFGFVKTTVDEIARQAQVGKGTIYFYFKSKEEILNALVDREMTKGFVITGQAMAEEPTIIGKLRKLIQTSFEYFHNNELVSKVMAMDQGLVLSIISEKNKEIQKFSIDMLKVLLEQGRNEGVFRTLEFEKVAYILDSLIRSFHYLSYLDLEIYKPDELLEPLLDLLSHGIETK